MNQETKIQKAIMLFSLITCWIAIFRIVSLTSIIGDYGNGFFAAAYEIYMIILMIATFGLSQTVQKMVSSRLERGQTRNAIKVLKCSVLLSIVLGILLFCFIFFGADFIADDFMFIKGSSFALKAVAPAIILIFLSGSIRGFLIATDQFVICSIIPIIEQIIIWIFSFLGVKYYFSYGKKVSGIVRDDMYAFIYGAKGSVVGILVGTLIVFIIYVVLLSKSRRKIKKLLRQDITIRDEYDGQVYHIILKLFLPIAFVILLIGIHGILSQRVLNEYFIKAGNTEYCIKYYGIYYVKIRNLLLVPISIFLTQFTFFEDDLKKKIAQDIRMARDFLKLNIRKVLFCSLPITFFIAVMNKEITGLLFGKGNIISEYVLIPGTILIVLYSMIIPTLYTIKVIKRTRWLIINLLLANLVYFISLIFMMKSLNMGIEALLYAALIFATILLLGNMFIIRRYMQYRQEMLFSIFIPYNAAFLAGMFILLFDKFAYGRIPNLLLLIIGGVIMFFLFWMIIGLFHPMKQDEMEEIPFGRLAYQLLKITKLHS